MLGGLEKTNPQCDDQDPNRLDAYLSRWNNVGRNLAFAVGPNSVETRTVKNGYLVSILRKDKGSVSFHFVRLPSPWIDGLGGVQPWKIDVEVPTGRKWAWAICPFRNRLTVAILAKDGLCVCLNVLAIQFFLTIRTRSFAVKRFTMDVGSDFPDELQPIECNPRGEIVRVDLLLTEYLIAAKVTISGKADERIVFVWNSKSGEPFVSPSIPLPKTRVDLMDLLKVIFGAVDANFIDRRRPLAIAQGMLMLWNFAWGSTVPQATFELGQHLGIGPGWVILRNYEYDKTGDLRANPGSGIVGIFPKRDSKPRFNLFEPKSSRRGFVIPVNTLSKETRANVKWEDWGRFATVIDPPEGYDLHVFHTHVLCLDPLTLDYYVFEFSPYTTRLNAAPRGGPVPDWVKSLSEPPTLPTTFSGRVKGLKPGNSSTEYFPTENDILAIEVSPIPIVILDFRRDSCSSSSSVPTATLEPL